MCIRDRWKAAVMQQQEEVLQQFAACRIQLLLMSLIHISEPTRLLSISYAVFCLKKKETHQIKNAKVRRKGQILIRERGKAAVMQKKEEFLKKFAACRKQLLQ